MSRIDHEDRLQGMAYAYERIKEDGLEAFAEELRRRKRNGITLLVPMKEIERHDAAMLNRAKKVVTVFAVSTLFDEFDFDVGQIERFMKRYDLKMSSLIEDDISWGEQIEILEKEMDVHIKFTEE